MSTKKDSLNGAFAASWRRAEGNRAINIRQIIIGALIQVSRLWKVLLFVYIPVLVLFIILDLVSRSSEHITLSYFTRDVAALGHLPFYAGLVSQLGGLMWTSTLAVCAFTLLILKKQDPNSGATRRLLFQALLLTTVLMLDDFFQLHEEIGPDYLHVGEKVIELGYLVLGILFLLTNFNEILSSEYLLLGLALVLFGASAFLDGAHLDKYAQYGFFFNEQFQTFLEDGLKFVGIVTWLTFFARYGYQKISSLRTNTEIQTTI